MFFLPSVLRHRPDRFTNGGEFNSNGTLRPQRTQILASFSWSAVTPATERVISLRIGAENTRRAWTLLPLVWVVLSASTLRAEEKKPEGKMAHQKITTFLMFEGKAEAAMTFYLSLFQRQ